MNWFWFNSIFSLYIFDRQKKAISFKIPDSSSCGQCKKEDKGNRKRTLSNGHWTSAPDNGNQDAKQSTERTKKEIMTKTLNALKVDCTGKCMKWKGKHNQSIRQITPQEMQVQSVIVVVGAETRGR